MIARFVILLGLLVAVVGCNGPAGSDQEPATEPVAAPDRPEGGVVLGPGPRNRYQTDWDISVEWEIFATDPPGPPHTEPYDRFAVQSGVGGYILVPGTGMADWMPCTGETEITLTLIGGSTYSFCARVDPHDASHSKDHSNFIIVFYPPNPSLPLPNKRCIIVAIGGDPGDVIHGGTAHGRG